MRSSSPTSALRRLGHHVRRHAGALWLIPAGLATALGLVGSSDLMGWVATWWIFAGVLAFVWMAAFTWLTTEARPFGPALPTGPIAGAVLVVTVGLVAMLGPGGLIVVALLAGLHPRVLPFVHFLLTRVTGRKRPVAADLRVAGGPEEDVPAHRIEVVWDVEPFIVADEVTVDDLCQAWCSSFVALQRARTMRAHLETVKMRALYLDDLERRLGEDFTRWLTSAPRAAQDPRSFLRPDERAGLDRGPDPERPAST